jgi:hypothetical protein
MMGVENWILSLLRVLILINPRELLPIFEPIFLIRLFFTLLIRETIRLEEYLQYALRYVRMGESVRRWIHANAPQAGQVVIVPFPFARRHVVPILFALHLALVPVNLALKVSTAIYHNAFKSVKMVEFVLPLILARVLMGGLIQTVRHLCVPTHVRMEETALHLTHALVQVIGQVLIVAFPFASRLV